MMVHPAVVICLCNLVEAALEAEPLLLHNRNLRLPVPHLLLVMGLEHILRVLMEGLEKAFHILLVHHVVQVMIHDRYTQELKDFYHILRVHQVPHTGQGVLLVDMGYHSLEVVVPVLLP